MINILNLGAGVQSSAVLLMACRGVLPRFDVAIFADTGFEPAAVYEHLKWLTHKAEGQGIPVAQVKTHLGSGSIKEDSLLAQRYGDKTDGKRWASMPYHVKNQDGSDGLVMRQCTADYKVSPVRRHIKEHVLGLKARQRWPKEHVVNQWFGISSDEAQRMRDSGEKWVRHVYPLCGIPAEHEHLEHPYTRQDCIKWLEHYYPARKIPRSACIACPFKSDAEWRKLRNESPAEWIEACDFDEAMRKPAGIDGEYYLHRQLVPLREAQIDGNKNQLNLWGNECGGGCGL